MTASLDWPRWTWPLAIASMAAPLGLVAGLRPEAAIVAALGLAFFLVVFADLSTGVVLFTLIAFFELIPGGGGIGLNFTKIAGLLLAISWMAHLATGADTRADILRVHPLISAVLILFLAWTLISMSWAEQPGDAVEAVYRLSLNAVLLMIVFTAVRTSRDVVRVLTAFVIGATLAILYGVLIAGVDPAPYGEVGRLAGNTENPNTLASTLVASFALALGLAFALKESPAARLAMLAISVFCLFGIFLTVSRTGLVSLGVAALAAIVLSGRWRPRVTVLATIIATVAVGYFAFFAPESARERVTAANGGTGREDIWAVAWRVVEDQPLRGIGAGNFDNTSIHYLLAPGSLPRSDFIVDTRKSRTTSISRPSQSWASSVWCCW